jgi:hypothetical protein
MNYSVELWSNYNKAQKTLHFHLQGLKNLISLYSEHYNCQNNYALLLKKTYLSKNQITVFESLFKGFNSFKSDMSNQYKYLNEFLLGLKDEIINPLSLLYQTTLKKLNYNIYEMSSIEKSYRSSVERLEDTKNNFHYYAKSAEESKIMAELYKERNNNNYNELIKEEETKMLDYLKRSKDNEKMYVETIDRTNELQEEYIEIKKRNLNELQEMEEEIAENIKDSFRKFIVFQVAYLRNMEYDIKNKSLIFENINIKRDINKFINNNKTQITQLYKYEYVPYISEFENKIVKDKNMPNIYSEKVKMSVKLFMSNVFSKAKPNEINPNSIYYKNKFILTEIKEIVNKIFNNEKLLKEEKEKINKLILLKKTRRKLLQEINNYCINNINSSLLNEISFENISNLLNESLKVLQIEKDYESEKLILNFATSFYQISGKSKKKKEFIQNELTNNKLFSKYEFWKELIKYNIIEEMYNQKKYNLFSNKKEDEEKNKQRIKEIVISKINLHINYMIDFNCKFSFMKQIFQEFKEYYELSDEELKKIEDKINKYNDKDSELNINNDINNDFEEKKSNDDLNENLNINQINNNSTDENSNK